MSDSTSSVDPVVPTPDVVPVEAPVAPEAVVPTAPDSAAPVVPPAAALAPAAPAVPEAEEVLALYPTVDGVQNGDALGFTDDQIARINEAGCDPGEVRNELGLVWVAKETAITLTEAIARAKVRYHKV